MSCCQLCKKLGSPDWNLIAEVEPFQCVHMEHTWHFGGAYANWTMTVTATAPDHLDTPDLTQFPVQRFDNLGRHFQEAVNLYESLRDCAGTY
jgi:hypothetical protein